MMRRILARYAFAHVDELRWEIVRSPLVAVGLALGAGLVAGGSKHGGRIRREAFEAAIAIVGSLVLTAAKDAALQSARDWLAHRHAAIH